MQSKPSIRKKNFFAAGETLATFGDNTTAGTHVAGMMSYLAADGIKKYLQNPSAWFR
jgi:hypothetical protein